MTTLITDTKTATALIRAERDRHTVVYGDYIAANGVTLETVKDHAKELTALAFKGVKPASRAAHGTPEYAANAFRTRIRNGLNSNLGKPKAAKDDSETNLLTTDGLDTLKEWLKDGGKIDDVINALSAEIERRAK